MKNSISNYLNNKLNSTKLSSAIQTLKEIGSTTSNAITGANKIKEIQNGKTGGERLQTIASIIASFI